MTICNGHAFFPSFIWDVGRRLVCDLAFFHPGGGGGGDALYICHNQNSDSDGRDTGFPVFFV